MGAPVGPHFDRLIGGRDAFDQVRGFLARALDFCAALVRSAMDQPGADGVETFDP